MAESGESMRVKLRERPMPDRLKWLAEKLDQDGEDPEVNKV